VAVYEDLSIKIPLINNCSNPIEYKRGIELSSTPEINDVDADNNFVHLLYEA
jgi:hypothetical protein